jgi:ABC-type xylose transport system substrate-binding protein
MRTLLALLLALPLLSGCTDDDPTTVALLLADTTGPEGVIDVDAFSARVESTCQDCDVTVYDAGGDAAEQASQARQAVTAESDVVVVEPVDADGLDGVSTDDIPVVSLVSLVPGSERFVGMATGAPGPSDQGSDLEAARDLVLGKRRSMTYVPARPMSEQAADVVVGQLAGTPVPGGEEQDGVTSWLYDTSEVTLDNLTTVLVGQGVITIDELCEGSTAKRCARFGLR